MNLALNEAVLPVRLRFERQITDRELAEFCADNEPMRVERDRNGELIVMSPTFSEGGRMEGELGLELGLWTRSDGRGKYFGPNSGFTLADSSVRAADAAWLTWKRWHALTGEQRNSFAPVCPEFVIEVRSSTDRLASLREKMLVWIANGAELGWLIDPERRVVEVYRAGEAVEVHENSTSVQGSGCVAGFELVMSRLWD